MKQSKPLPPQPGKPQRYDYEYRRHGTVNLFICFEPHNGWRKVIVTERRTKIDAGSPNESFSR